MTKIVLFVITIFYHFAFGGDGTAGTNQPSECTRWSVVGVARTLTHDSRTQNRTEQ